MARRHQSEDWFWQLGSELQRLSDEVMQGIVATASAARRSWRPNVDLCECENNFQITAELAGIDPEQVHVHYSPQHHSVVIRGRRQAQGVGDPAVRCYQLEVLYGDFEREVGLPDVPIDKDGIRAKYVNGVLIITIPKEEQPPDKREEPSVRRSVKVTKENGGS